VCLILKPVTQFKFLSIHGTDKGLGSLSLKDKSFFHSNHFDISEKLPKCGDTRADGS